MLVQCGRDRARQARSDSSASRQDTVAVSRSLLADRRIRYVLGAYVASGSADGFLPVVLSFAVLRLTGSPGRLGLVLACQSTAALLVTLAGGLAGDRFPRGRILTGSLAVRAAAATVLAATLLTGTASFPLLLTMAAAYGCADGFFGPASIALLPDIVSRTELAPANALLGGTTSTATIASPAIAGVIVAVLGTGAGFAVQAAVLAIAAGAVTAARLPAPRAAPPGRPVSAGRPHPLGQLKTGWAEFARLRWLWLLTGQWTVFSMVILAPVAVLGPTIANRYLGGLLAWGIIRSSLSLGAVAGQLTAGRISPPARPALRIAWLMPAMTAQALALGLGAPLAAIAAAAMITGLAIGLQAVLFQTAMQTSIPPETLACVTAFDLLGSEGGQPIGYALAGPLGNAIGPRTYLTYSATGIFVAASAFTLLRPLRTETGTTSHPQTNGEPAASEN